MIVWDGKNPTMTPRTLLLPHRVSQPPCWNSQETLQSNSWGLSPLHFFLRVSRSSARGELNHKVSDTFWTAANCRPAALEFMHLLPWPASAGIMGMNTLHSFYSMVCMWQAHTLVHGFQISALSSNPGHSHSFILALRYLKHLPNMQSPDGILHLPSVDLIHHSSPVSKQKQHSPLILSSVISSHTVTHLPISDASPRISTKSLHLSLLLLSA